MKKWLWIPILGMLLAGCGSETFETVDDEVVRGVIGYTPRVAIEVEEGAMVLETEGGTIYLCDGYDVSLQVFPSGNLENTAKEICGLESNQLNMVQSVREGWNCYTWVWCAMGENGELVGRCTVFDDGVYHYCISFLADAGDSQALIPAWNAIVDSLHIA